MTPSAASSRSALRVTMAGFFPPISVMIGRGKSFVKLLYSFIPTSYEPVNTMPSMPGFSWSSAPTVSPGPVTRLKTPSGSPASRSASANFQPLSGASQLGFSTTVLPAIIAPPAGPPASAIGKLNGLMTPKTPYGRRTERVRSVGDREPIGLHEAVGLLELVAVVAQQVGGLLDVAEGLEPVLADLERHERGVVELPLADEVGGAAQDGEPIRARACRASRGRPRGPRRPRRCTSSRVPTGKRATTTLAVDRRAILERRRRRIRSSPPMSIGYVRPELGTRPLERGIEGRLQLLVVRRERGVGDLHARRVVVIGSACASCAGCAIRAGSARGDGRGVAAIIAPLESPGTPKARLRGEKSLAFGRPDDIRRVRTPQDFQRTFGPPEPPSRQPSASRTWWKRPRFRPERGAVRTHEVGASAIAVQPRKQLVRRRLIAEVHAGMHHLDLEAVLRHQPIRRRVASIACATTSGSSSEARRRARSIR